jgi:hypothetical protein
MAKILKEMMSQLEGADISDAAFEASNIVFYTKIQAVPFQRYI